MRNPVNRPTRHLVAALALAGGLALVGCGDDNAENRADQNVGSGQGTASGETTNEGIGTEMAGGGSGIVEGMGIDGASEALDGLGLENKGSALVSAMGADRFEVEGDVLHVYVSDASRVPAGTECMVVGAILSDGEMAVVHLADGTEVSCD